MAITFLLPAVALYKAPHFTGYDSNNVISINVDRIQAFTPRPAWIKRYLVPGQNQIQYLLTFEPSSADLADPNILTGVYIEQDGQGVVIDCISVSNFQSAANGAGSITQTYPSGVPIWTSPVALAFCLSRADDGSGFAHSQVVMQYLNQYVGNIRMRSNISGISHYVLFSYTVPIPQLNPQYGVSGNLWVLDTITAGNCTS